MMDTTPPETSEALTDAPRWHERGIAAVTLTTVLFAATLAALANNFIGVLAVLAAPLWLPVGCYYVSFHLVFAYLVVSGMCMLLTLPIALFGPTLGLPEGFASVFGLVSLFIFVGSALGTLIAHCKKNAT